MKNDDFGQANIKECRASRNGNGNGEADGDAVAVNTGAWMPSQADNWQLATRYQEYSKKWFFCIQRIYGF